LETRDLVHELVSPYGWSTALNADLELADPVLAFVRLIRGRFGSIERHHIHLQRCWLEYLTKICREARAVLVVRAHGALVKRRARRRKADAPI